MNNAPTQPIPQPPARPDAAGKPSMLVVGAGGHGRVVEELARALGYGKIDFADDFLAGAAGGLKDLPALAPRYDAAAVSLGNLSLRRELLQVLRDAGAALPPLVHPAAFASPSATLGAGALVLPGAVVHTRATVGAGAIVSAGAVVDHDATVGECAHVDAGAVVAPRAAVPALTKVPAGETFRGTEGRP